MFYFLCKIYCNSFSKYFDFDTINNAYMIRDITIVAQVSDAAPEPFVLCFCYVVKKSWRIDDYLGFKGIWSRVTRSKKRLKLIIICEHETHAWGKDWSYHTTISTTESTGSWLCNEKLTPSLHTVLTVKRSSEKRMKGGVKIWYNVLG